MNSEPESHRESDREQPCPQVRQLSAREVPRMELRPLEVPADTELVLTPADPAFASNFARVSLRSYDDLQTLGLVPRRLSEEKVRRAMTKDDEESFELAAKRSPWNAPPCGCGGKEASSSGTRPRTVRSQYNVLRKRHNPALAGLLSEHYNASLAWDAPVPALVRKWVVALAVKPQIIVALLGDITIQRNATLTVAPLSKSLMAWNIWIHRTGRLRHQGSYLKVWANSISRFTDYLSPAVIASAQKLAPLWLLQD